MRKVLARRERQILDVLYQLGEATAKEVEQALDEDLANATIRTQLRILEQKGAVVAQQTLRCFCKRRPNKYVWKYFSA